MKPHPGTYKNFLDAFMDGTRAGNTPVLLHDTIPLHPDRHEECDQAQHPQRIAHLTHG